MGNGRRGSTGNGSGFDPDRLRGKAALDFNGETLGEIIDVYKDPTSSIALLAKIRMPDRSLAAIPVAAAEPLENGHQGIKVKIDRDALIGGPALKSSRSVLVSPARVEAIYSHHGTQLAFAHKPKAARATGRSRSNLKKRNFVTFPGASIGDVLAGRAQPRMV